MLPSFPPTVQMVTSYFQPGSRISETGINPHETLTIFVIYFIPLFPVTNLNKTGVMVSIPTFQTGGIITKIF